MGSLSWTTGPSLSRIPEHRHGTSKQSACREEKGPASGPFVPFEASTSKSGIRIPLACDEDIKSSTESTISASELPYQIVNKFMPAGVVNVEMKIGNLQSLLVCPIFI